MSGPTVNTKLVGVVDIPSFTEIVMVVFPLWFKAGVMVAVRLAPLPVNTMLAFGTTVVLLDVAVNVRSPSGVSASLMVIATGNGVSSSVA